MADVVANAPVHLDVGRRRVGLRTMFAAGGRTPDGLAPGREAPELRFVEQRDPVSLRAQPLDLHEL